MKHVYIILRHRRHWFGIRTEPVEAHMDLEVANIRRDFLDMKSDTLISRPSRNRYTIAITKLQ